MSAMLANMDKSASRVWCSMNVFSGLAPRSSAVSKLMVPVLSGWYAWLYIWSNTGDMAKNVKKRARPISTELGGDVGVPMALRNRPSTMMMRVKPVIINSIAGRNDSIVSSSNVWTLRSEEHTSELQSLMRISYAVFCLQKKQNITN